MREHTSVMLRIWVGIAYSSVKHHDTSEVSIRACRVPSKRVLTFNFIQTRRYSKLYFVTLRTSSCTTNNMLHEDNTGKCTYLYNERNICHSFLEIPFSFNQSLTITSNIFQWFSTNVLLNIQKHSDKPNCPMPLNAQHSISRNQSTHSTHRTALRSLQHQTHL